MPELQLSILWEDSFRQQSNFCGPLVILPSLLNIVTCQPLEYWRPKEATTAANLIVTSLPTALARLPNKSQAQKVNKNFPTDFPIHPSKCVGKEAKMFVLGKQRSNYDDVGHHSTLGQKCKIFPRILCCHWFVLSVDRNSRENEAIMTWWTWGQWCHLDCCWFYSKMLLRTKKVHWLHNSTVATAVTRKGEESLGRTMKRCFCQKISTFFQH